MLDTLDFLPLSMINQFAYCPRRFWLMFVWGEMEVNAVVLDGQQKHQNAHHPAAHWHPDGRVYTAVWVWSEALRIAGIADFVHMVGDNTLIPLEHKRGRMGQHLSDHLQVCAQALCLEERTGRRVERGEIFCWANRRREIVELDAALRAKTIAAIQQIYDSLAQGRLPEPLDHPAKCRDCSLQPICLPDEVRQLRKE